MPIRQCVPDFFGARVTSTPRRSRWYDNVVVVLGAENGVATVRLVGTEAVVGIFFALFKVTAPTGSKTTEGNLVCAVRTASKVREGPFTEPLTLRSLVAVRSKVSVRTFAGGLCVTQRHTRAPSGAIELELRTRILVAFVSPPGSLADALGIGVGHGQGATEVSGSTRTVFPAIGVGAEIGLAIWPDNAGLALAGLGPAIAVRVGSVAIPRTIAGALGSLDDSRKRITAIAAFLEIAVFASGLGIAIDGRLIGGLVSETNTCPVVTPGHVIEIPVAAPDVFSIVLTANEAVVPTLSSGNAQKQFVLGPAIANHGITELDHPIVR